MAGLREGATRQREKLRGTRLEVEEEEATQPRASTLHHSLQDLLSHVVKLTSSTRLGSRIVRKERGARR